MSVTLGERQMKRKDDWRGKLDEWALEFLEGYRKASSASKKFSDSPKLREMLDEIAAKHPQIRSLGNVEILPEFLDRLRRNELFASALSSLKPTPGTKTLPRPAARFVDVMQLVTLALDDPEMRILAGYAAGMAALTFGNIYTDISKRNFGDAGPKKPEDQLWTIGTTLEVLGKGLKSGKPPYLKGKVDVELVELIKALRHHEKVRLTYRELREALAYAGVHVPDEDALRLFEWRAKKRGWLQDEKDR